MPLFTLHRYVFSTHFTLETYYSVQKALCSILNHKVMRRTNCFPAAGQWGRNYRERRRASPWPCLYMGLIPFSTCALFALFFQPSCYLRLVAGNFKLAPPTDRAHHVQNTATLAEQQRETTTDCARFIHFYIHLQNDDPVPRKKFRVLHSVCRLARKLFVSSSAAGEFISYCATATWKLTLDDFRHQVRLLLPAYGYGSTF